MESNSKTLRKAVRSVKGRIYKKKKRVNCKIWKPVLAYMREEIAKGGGEKKPFPYLKHGSMAKEDGKYQVLHHSQKTTKAKVTLKFRNHFKVMIHLPFSLPYPASFHPPAWRHIQTHAGKLCALAGKPHWAECLKMYVTHDGLRADAVCDSKVLIMTADRGLTGPLATSPL